MSEGLVRDMGLLKRVESLERAVEGTNAALQMVAERVELEINGINEERKEEMDKLFKHLSAVDLEITSLRTRLAELEEEKKAGQFPKLSDYRNNGGWPKN
jgi:hypothetical protein